MENCKLCAKQYLCSKEKCTGLVRWRETKNYGEVRRIGNGKQQRSERRIN